MSTSWRVTHHWLLSWICILLSFAHRENFAAYCIDFVKCTHPQREIALEPEAESRSGRDDDFTGESGISESINGIFHGIYASSACTQILSYPCMR